LRAAKFTSTAGAVVGVVTGCCLGMINLLFIDLGSSERQRQAAELKVRLSLTKRGASAVLRFRRGRALRNLDFQVPFRRVVSVGRATKVLQGAESVVWLRSLDGFKKLGASLGGVLGACDGGALGASNSPSSLPTSSPTASPTLSSISLPRRTARW